MERSRFARRPSFGWTLGLVWVVGLAAIQAAARGAGDDPGAAPDNGDVEVLTRGPVHEAFAAPVVNDPEPGLVVPKAPPQAVEELPPDQKPAGENVQWIPGYWSWDQSRDDFVWISGVWREPPPGRQWVPGYWSQAPGGHQWVPGAWIPIEAEENQNFQSAPTVQGPATYLPAPPASLEVGPNVPSPGGNVFWSPGCWFWRQSRYVWRPGFWTVARSNWVWAPAHYIWTPGGYLFVEGYWDLPLANRGMLFAPVYFARPVFLRPAFVYTPMITIAAPGLMANLFVQPRYNHYVFGDFYDQRFLSVGIFPWFSITHVSGPRRPFYHDPLFAYYSAINAPGNPGWAAARRADYAFRRDNIASRPPRTYIEQTRMVQNNITINRNVTVVNPGARPALMTDRELGQPLARVAARSTAADGLRMERLGADSRRQLRERSVQLAEFRAQRASREIQPPPSAGRPRELAANTAGAPGARPFAMSRSPIAAPAARPAAGRFDPQTARTRAEAPAPRLAGPARPQQPPQPQQRVRPQQPPHQPRVQQFQPQSRPQGFAPGGGTTRAPGRAPGAPAARPGGMGPRMTPPLPRPAGGQRERPQHRGAAR